jgi:uncharacterized protein (TIGR03437 family)
MKEVGGVVSSGLHRMLEAEGSFSSGRKALLLLVLPALHAFPAFPALAPESSATILAPSYSAESIVNGATQTAGALAPNAIATLYGANLSFQTYSVATHDVHGGALPTSAGGVTVLVNYLAAPLFYVSPGQINFLVPYELLPGPVSVVVIRQNLAGPVVKIQLNSTSPGLFPWNGNLAIATHLNGALVSAGAPAHGGEIIVLYVDGLGRVTPDTDSGRIVSFAAAIVAARQLQILLNGVACPAANVLYAGLAPGFAGLYQINLVLPAPIPPNPEIRIAVGAQISPPSIQLAAQ